MIVEELPGAMFEIVEKSVIGSRDAARLSGNGSDGC